MPPLLLSNEVDKMGEIEHLRSGDFAPLKEWKTYELMEALQFCRAKGWVGVLIRGEDGVVESISLTLEDVKAVLATRPHVPNKKERRKIRQDLAKRGKK